MPLFHHFPHTDDADILPGCRADTSLIFQQQRHHHHFTTFSIQQDYFNTHNINIMPHYEPNNNRTCFNNKNQYT